jgi:hypothetical protein
MGVDFFRNDMNVEEPNQPDTFTSADMDQKAPNFFKDDEPKEEKSPEKKAENDVNPEKEEESREIKAEAKSEKVENSEPESKEESIKEAQAEVDKAIKKLSAMLGEEKFEIPAEAKFKAKVDGEEREVAIQELLNNYSGKQAWDKKFSELDSERKTYKEDLEVVNRYINDFAEVSKKDKIEGLITLAKAVGIDPLDYKRQLRGELLNKYGEYLAMDEEQRAYFEQQEELEYLKSQRDEENRRRAQQQANMELQKQYEAVAQQYSIEWSDVENYANELHQGGHQVTPENVAYLHETNLRLDRAEAAIGQVNASYVEDDDKVLQLESLLVGNPQLTDEQLVDYATRLWGNDVEKAVVELEKKAAPAPKEQQPPKMTARQKLNVIGNNLNLFD